MNLALKNLILTSISFLFNFLNDMLAAVPQAQAGVALMRVRIEQTVNALFDADPNNKEQLTEIWLKNFVNEDLTNWSDAYVAEQINKIENLQIRSSLLHVAPKVIEMIRLASDDNPNNQQQITEAWAQFFEDQKTKILVCDQFIDPGFDRLALAIRGAGSDTPALQ